MINGNSYYRVLGVPRNATPDQIKAAYRQLAQLYHPDSPLASEIVASGKKQEDVEELFRAITAGYHLLLNPEKRSRYDSTLPPELKDWEQSSGLDPDAQYQEDLRRQSEVDELLASSDLDDSDIARPVSASINLKGGVIHNILRFLGL